MLYGECYQASSTGTKLTHVFVVNSSRMKTSTTVLPWDGSYHECPTFVTSKLVDGCALPHFEGNGEAAAQEEWDSSDFAVSRPWGYVIPVGWLILLLLFLYTCGEYHELLLGWGGKHPCITSVLLVNRWAPFDMLTISLSQLKRWTSHWGLCLQWRVWSPDRIFGFMNPDVLWSS